VEREGDAWKVFFLNQDIVQFCHALARMSDQESAGLTEVVLKEEMKLADFRSFLVHFYAVSVLWVHFHNADEAVDVCDLNRQQLSFEEFTLAVKTLTTAKGNKGLGAEQIRADFEQLDIDKSGSISFSEVVFTCARYIDPKYIDPKYIDPKLPPHILESSVPEYIRKLQQEEDRARKLVELPERAAQIGQEKEEQGEQTDKMGMRRSIESWGSREFTESTEGTGKSRSASKEADLLRSLLASPDIGDVLLAELEGTSAPKLGGQHLSPKDRNLSALNALQNQIQLEKSTADYVSIKHATQLAIDLLLAA
jgi:hypothetical protein